MRTDRKWRLVSLGAALALACSAATIDTRLVDAAKQQNWRFVRELLSARADVNAIQEDGATALHWAAHGERGE
jgi:ankyrin repeat protein